MVMSKSKAAILTKKAKTSMDGLQQIAGRDHVRVIAVKATFLSNTQICATAEQICFFCRSQKEVRLH